MRIKTICIVGENYIVMPRSHIQRSPAEFVDRQKVAEIQIRQGIERIFRLKSTLSHFGRGSGGALWTSRPARARQYTNESWGKPARQMGGRGPSIGQLINSVLSMRRPNTRPTLGRQAGRGSTQRPAKILAKMPFFFFFFFFFFFLARREVGRAPFMWRPL